MILAEGQKLLHKVAFRFFLCLFLIAGALSPLITGLDRTTPELYKAYDGMSTDEVLADIELRGRNLEIIRALELNAMLPEEIAEVLLDGLAEQYGLTMEEMEAIDSESQLIFTDDAWSESQLLNTVRAQAERAMGYSAYLQSIRDQEQTIRNSILYRDNPYALALARKTSDAYVGLDGLTLPLADPTGVEILLGTWVDDALSCGVAALTAMYAFLQERQDGMLPLLFSTKRGRRATYLAKLGLIILLGAGSCGVFTLFRMALAGDLGDLTRPVQTIPAFYTAPYRISVGMMVALNLLQRMGATVLVGAGMSILCITMERSLALGTAAALTLIQVLCWNLIDSASVFQPLKYLSVPALFSGPTLLGNGVFVKLLGTAVSFVHTSLVLLLGGGVGLVLLGIRLYSRMGKTIALPIRPKKGKTPKRLPSLMLLELEKLLVHQKAALLLLLVLALQPRFYDSFHARITTDELRYLSVIKSVEGTYTEEKQQSLELRRNDLTTQLAQTTEPLMEEELSARLRAVEQVIALGEYLKTRPEPVEFVYETGYEAMFGLRPVGIGYQEPLIALALCLMLPGLFTQDRETGMAHLLSTTKGFRRLRRVKWKLAWLVTVLVFLICRVPEVWFITKAFDLSCWTAPVASLQTLSGYPGAIPIWLAVAVLWLTRCGWALGACTLVCVLSEKLGKYLSAVLASALLLGAVLILL